jgi:hypothetical protein
MMDLLCVRRSRRTVVVYSSFKYCIKKQRIAQAPSFHRRKKQKARAGLVGAPGLKQRNYRFGCGVVRRYGRISL